MSKDEFARYFKKRDFSSWLNESNPFKDISDLPSGGMLKIIHEGGTIRTITNEELSYRYNLGGDESCSSIQLADGKLVVGTADDKSLSVWRLPNEYGYIIGIQNKYFFVRYFDRTESRGRDEYGSPRDPVQTFANLYYVRQQDGKIAYQGQIEKLTSPDPNLRLRDKEFCQYSYSAEFN
jgi:hypothetical protein